MFVTSGKKKGSIRRETSVVSGMRATIVQSRHQKAVPASEPQNSKTRGRCVSRKRKARGRSQSEKFNRPPCKYFLKGGIGILQNVNSTKLNRNVSSAQRAHSRTGRLKNNQTKSR